MGNHWHMLLWPRGDADLSDYMRWITLTHTQRYHASHGTVGIGHLYQGRFKSFPTQNDEHYLTVLRYIEANPLRAEIVARPGEYPWSSFAARKGLEKPFALSDGPLPIPKNWAQLVGRKLAVADQDQISNSIRRGAPLGDPDWVKHTAAKLNLQSTIKPRGRPRKSTGHLQFAPRRSGQEKGPSLISRYCPRAAGAFTRPFIPSVNQKKTPVPSPNLFSPLFSPTYTLTPEPRVNAGFASSPAAYLYAQRPLP